MTPDERAARLHLTDAAAALRTASERLCDWLEATGQDVAGNGHVASADEAAGSFRGAPTAPVSSSPPPIPLGAVVEVAGDEFAPFVRVDGGWKDRLGDVWCDGSGTSRAPVYAALYHARREREEATQERDRALERAARALDDAAMTQRERDEARRALAAKQDQGLGASAPNSEGQGPMIPTDGPPSPAPASAPRRWWLVVDRDGYPVYACSSERLAVERAQEDNENVPRPAFTPYSVVPVVEARVTRETVEEIAATLTSSLDITPSRSIGRTVARLVAKRIGLTVEE